MNKDFFGYYEKDVAEVFTAYRIVISEKLKQTMRQANEFWEITFRWTFLWNPKYNINPGVCKLRFIRYKSGTALYANFSNAQMFGAKFDRLYEDMNTYVSQMLGVPAQPIVLSKEVFLQADNIVHNHAGAVQPPTASHIANTQEPAPGDALQAETLARKLAPFVFLSYARKNKEQVLPLFNALKTAGLPIWYDDGIRAGAEWEVEIIKNLSSSSAFLFFVSEASLASQNCRDELYQARKKNKKFIHVLIEDIDLSKPEHEWFDFRYSRYQQIPAYAMAEEDVIHKIIYSLEDE